MNIIAGQWQYVFGINYQCSIVRYISVLRCIGSEGANKRETQIKSFGHNIMVDIRRTVNQITAKMPIQIPKRPQRR